MLFDKSISPVGYLMPNFGKNFIVDDNNGGGDGTPPAGTPPAGDPPKPWFDSLPDTIKADPNITKYKTVEEFATGHLNAVKMIGAKGVIVPKPDAPQEEKDKFYNTLGRPEKPEGYKLSEIEGLHKGIAITPESRQAFLSQAHKLGLTTAQADDLNKWYLSVLSQALSNQDKAHEDKLKEVGTKLQAEWGKDYQQNLTMANRLLEKFGGKEAAQQYLGEGADPQLIKIFGSIAKLLSEDSIHSIGFSNLAASAGDAKRKIAEIRSDSKHPFNVADDPNHDQAVQDMYQLHKIAEGQV